MSNIKSNAVFYSKNSNIIIADRVRSCLKELKIHTIYLNEIDDIILKQCSNIPLLILDFTTNFLDDRSMELLIKLKNQGYINYVVIIENKNNKYKNIDLVINENEIEKSLKNFAINSISSTKFKNDDKSLVSVIGKYLIDMGFSFKHYGYLILIKALSFYLSNDKFIKNLNRNLYPYLANSFLTTESNIEMDLRTAIKNAYKNNKINGNFSTCPTIKEFLNFAITQIYSNIYVS